MSYHKKYSGLVYNILAFLVDKLLGGAVICEECDD